jgi:hypothetical protein
LRNVGRGLAVIDRGGVALTGPLIGPITYRTIQRQHVPVGETTRVDLISTDLTQQGGDLAGERVGMRGVSWQLTVPYCDFAGAQRTVAHLELVCHGDDVNGPWLVERVEQESPRGQLPAPEQESLRGQGPAPEQKSPRDQGPAHEQESRGDDLPDADLSPPTAAGRRRAGVKNQPVTDLWGNPKTPRRRNR